MDSAAFFALVALCAPLVDPATAAALVRVESNTNPHAIGIVGGALRRQPKSAAEALVTANALERSGWNLSVGLAQINARNFQRLGLTLADAFDPCRNLQAMQALLGECFARTASLEPQRALRRALSCYDSGNFVRGFEDGYVARVVGAARHEALLHPPRPPP
jgi:type IV secretion system protein VirB1